MFKIFKYLRRSEWAQVGAAVVFVVVQVWLNLKMPDYMAEITRLVETPGSAMSDVWHQGVFMLLCALGSLAASVIVGFFAARVAAAFSRRLRSLLFNKVDSFSMEEINRFSTASLITRSSNDITQIQMLVTMGLSVIISAPVMAVWAVIKIAGKGLEWTLATGVAVLVIIAVMALLMVFVMPKFRSMQRLTDNMNRVTRENLTGLRVIRAYNAEDFEEAKFEQANGELTDTQLYTSRAMAFMMPVMSMVMNGLSLAIYWIGAYVINNAAGAAKLMIFSNMVVFSAYAMQVVMAFMMMIVMFVMLPRAAVSATRINEVLDTVPVIVDGIAVAGQPDVRGEIEFRDVSFKYPDAAEYVLRDVSFTASQGQTVAFIGSTGSGKTTLVNLVPRFFDVTSGEVLVDGVDVKRYTGEALHNKIGYVPQEAVMFRGTVSSNVGYGDNGRGAFTSGQIAEAIDVAQATDFVGAMDGELDAEISQGGKNVSGGQKQRLSIARAVCRKPEVYIFDDSFSALDYKTDRALRTALKKQTAGVTSLIVAQRIGTIMDADQIVVLDDGRVVGHGTHKELLATCDVYKQIALSQLSEEELGAQIS